MRELLTGLAYGAERNVILELRKPGFENKPWGIVIPWNLYNVANKEPLIEELVARYIEEMPNEAERVGIENVNSNIRATLLQYFPDSNRVDYMNLLEGDSIGISSASPVYPNF